MKHTLASCLAALLAGFGGPVSADDGESAAGPPAPENGGTDSAAGEDGATAEIAGDARSHQAAIDRALEQLNGEPSLAELQRAALRLADADPERARNWMRAPNLAPILPRFKVTLDHDLEHDESLDRDQVKPDKWGADTDRDLELQFSAQWELSELVFNPDEVRVYGALANRAQRRESLLATLVGTYFERRKLQLVEILEPASELAESIERKLRIDELTAMIDALTGGLLSRTLEAGPKARVVPR
jgi:hypothetical protein